MGVRFVDLMALPPAVRDRLENVVNGLGTPQPITSVPFPQDKAFVAWFFVALGAVPLALYLMLGFGTVSVDGVGGTSGLTYFFVVPAFFFLFAGLLTLRRRLARRGLSFPPGRYILPTDIVIAEARTLAVLPLASIEKVQRTEVFRSGQLVAVHLTLFFPGGLTETFEEHQVDMERIEATTQRLAEARAAGDEATLRANDVFHDLRSGQEWGTTSRPLAVRALRNVMPVAIALAFLVGLPVGWLRGWASDAVAFASLEGAPTEQVRRYLELGGLRRVEAEAMLTRLPSPASP